jgi:hypothetical protein
MFVAESRHAKKKKDANTSIMQMNTNFTNIPNKAMQIESLLSKLTRAPDAAIR